MEKPTVKLNPLEKTAVSTPTEEEYGELMRVFESGKWKWLSGDVPTKFSYWISYDIKTCVEAGKHFFTSKKGEFGYADTPFYKEKGWNIISPEEFYAQQPNVTPEKRAEINNYFDGLKE